MSSRTTEPSSQALRVVASRTDRANGKEETCCVSRGRKGLECTRAGRTSHGETRRGTERHGEARIPFRCAISWLSEPATTGTIHADQANALDRPLCGYVGGIGSRALNPYLHLSTLKRFSNRMYWIPAQTGTLRAQKRDRDCAHFSVNMQGILLLSY